MTRIGRNPGLRRLPLIIVVCAIGALVRGSRTGQEAVMTVGVAARSLSLVAASMKSLGRMCDNYVRGVSQ